MTKVDGTTTLKNFPLSVYDGDPNKGGKLIASGQSDANGLFSQKISLPTAQSNIFVLANSIGLCPLRSVPVIGSSATLDSSLAVPNDTSLVYSRSFNKVTTNYKTLGT